MNPMKLFFKLPHWRTALLGSSVLLFICTSVQAQTVTVDFDSLPSSQGWTYEGNLAENTAFFADSFSLLQTTVGSGGRSFAIYSMLDILDSSKRLTLSFTARVIIYEQVTGGSDGLGLNFIAHDGEIQHRLGMTDNLLLVDGQYILLDTTVFHDYVFILNPGGTSEAFVDGVLVASGRGYRFASNNKLIFGDSTAHENSDAEITAMSFTVADVSEILIDDIEALADSGIVNGKQLNGLIVKLDAFVESLDRGNTTAACNQLLAFINQVASFVSSGTLNPEEGQALINSANAILAQNSC